MHVIPGTKELIQWSVTTQQGFDVLVSALHEQAAEKGIVQPPDVLFSKFEGLFVNLLEDDRPAQLLWTTLSLLQLLSGNVSPEEKDRIEQPFDESDQFLRQILQASVADINLALTAQKLLCGFVPQEEDQQAVESLFDALLMNCDDVDLGVSFFKNCKLPQPYPILTMRKLSEKPSAVQVYTLVATLAAVTNRDTQPQKWET